MICVDVTVIELPCNPPTVEVKVVGPAQVPRASRVAVSMINDFKYEDNCEATDSKNVRVPGVIFLYVLKGMTHLYRNWVYYFLVNYWD